MPSANLPRRVGIVGLGLMGGSVARALKRLDPPPRIRAFTRETADAQTALEQGVIDDIAADPADAVRDQELVVYAAPLRVTVELMAAHADLIGEATITDVVGLKEPLMRQAQESGLAERYVGAHPMVGGTGSGFSASTEGLFVDGIVWMVHGDAARARVDCVESVWRSFGARTRSVPAAEHDRLMVWASHLPQLVATALARVLSAEGLDAADLGAGGLDMTRLAMSSSEMWRDLFQASADLDASALKAVEKELALLRAALEEKGTDTVGKMMDQIGPWREKV